MQSCLLGFHIYKWHFLTCPTWTMPHCPNRCPVVRMDVGCRSGCWGVGYRSGYRGVGVGVGVDVEEDAESERMSGYRSGCRGGKWADGCMVSVFLGFGSPAPLPAAKCNPPTLSIYVCWLPLCIQTHTPHTARIYVQVPQRLDQYAC